MKLYTNAKGVHGGCYKVGGCGWYIKGGERFAGRYCFILWLFIEVVRISFNSMRFIYIKLLIFKGLI